MFYLFYFEILYTIFAYSAFKVAFIIFGILIKCAVYMLFKPALDSLPRLPDINLPIYRIGNLINESDKITSYSFSFFFLLYR